MMAFINCDSFDNYLNNNVNTSDHTIGASRPCISKLSVTVTRPPIGMSEKYSVHMSAMPPLGTLREINEGQMDRQRDRWTDPTLSGQTYRQD
jgi:hypothetical protein